LRLTALSLCFLFSVAISAFAQSGRPITITADLTDAPRKMIHGYLTMPVTPGPLTLVYPKWLPGEHSPTGPIKNLAGITFTVNGRVIPWQRDDVDMFALHVRIPEGAASLHVQLDFLATAPASGFSAGASTTENLAVLSWNELALYPAGKDPATIMVEPSVTALDGWKLGTALTAESRDGITTHFAAIPLTMLIDSPVLSGRFFKEIALAPEITPKHFLDIAADGPEDLNVSQARIEAFSALIREAGALFASRHYNSYHFLLTLSDQVAHFGLEHHQSSDDRNDERTFLDDDIFLLAGDLLPHEFAHSWNGKYRRPAGLATPNYQEPMKGNLLWVYEGLTQYLGDVLAVRSGIWSSSQYRDYLADSTAQMNHRPGRTWRDLEDTAVSAQVLYDSSQPWDNWRRSTDYYQEGELIWLEADTLIRKLSHGQKSLNDFCKLFFGAGGDTGPVILTYTFDDLIKALNTVQANDWAKFFEERLTTKSPRAPLGGIANGGYRIVYTDQPNDYTRAAEDVDHAIDAWYSIGLLLNSDGEIQDVLVDSVAYRAGLGPGMKIIAVDNRKMTEGTMRRAIQTAKENNQSIELIVENTGYFRVVKLDYHEGQRYPILERTDSPDVLADILKPMVPAKTPTLRAAVAVTPAAGH
jgi:predicted metalloprotease with PDZ domain